MVHPGAFHPLTPGSPAYAMLKVGAVGSIFALRFALMRRNRQKGASEAPEQLATEPAAEPQPPAHPVSRKKKRRRRR
jgi:hypothetical protein